jgi:uncharacterized membrane protein YhaH (DUF805 family)
MFSRNRPDRDDRRLYALSGRSNRAEFWAVVSVLIVVGYILHHLGAKAPIWTLATASGWFGQRRLHDFGQSGWWFALPIGGFLVLPAIATLSHSFMLFNGAVGLAGLLTVVFLLIIGAIPGDAGSNRFGPPIRSRRIPAGN